ncbi:TetR family transcriptional regulator [Arsenophonus sp.]|uniref:TetR family transcriptional regulator n=1 Tax=Arsenophonus sp. TaxID=1872640 RepID=UPI003879FC03
MNKSNQHSPYRLTGESVKNYPINKQNKKLTLIDKLILLFGGLFIFYFLTLIIK